MAEVLNFQIQNLKDLQKISDFLLNHIQSGTIFLLNGQMSSGKTTLISTLLLNLKIQNVSSPTYAIHQVYDYDKIKIHHLDLHRMENEDDIESSGIWDLFINSEDIFFIEWADKIDINFLPLYFKIIKIDIDKKNENQRHIKLQF